MEMNILLDPNINPVNAFFLLIQDRGRARLLVIEYYPKKKQKKNLAPSLGWWKTKGPEPNHFFWPKGYRMAILISSPKNIVDLLKTTLQLS